MKKKVILAAVLFAFLVTNAMATGDKNKDKNKSTDGPAPVTLTGTVVDKSTGEALAGVLVKINETDTVVYSDFEGNFELLVLPGDYSLSATFISYETAKINMTANGSQNKMSISLDNVSKKK